MNITILWLDYISRKDGRSRAHLKETHSSDTRHIIYTKIQGIHYKKVVRNGLLKNTKTKTV